MRREGLPWPHLQFRRTLLVNQNRPALSVSIRSKATPGPLSGFQHQSPPHRVAMNIPQLLALLDFAAYNEIIKPRLPDMTGIERLCPQLALPRPSPPAQFSQHAASKTLLHNLHHGGLGTPLRFADQQMNMLGHNHVPGYDETITGPHLFEDFEKEIPPPRRAEKSQAMVAAEGDEMRVAGAVITMQAPGHGGIVLGGTVVCL